MGSSPRMRGSRECILEHLALIGIIPAHAGLTRIVCECTNPTRGSSPRMRGSLFQAAFREVTRGIIPAHAGLTMFSCPSIFWIRDHPRACGAHQNRGKMYRMLSGSSPRMRGSLDRVVASVIASGIIPAHAGLTLKNPNNDAILSVSNPIFYSVLRVIL